MPGLGTAQPEVTTTDPASDAAGVVVRQVGGSGQVSSATATVTRVAVTSAGVQVLASNANRKGFEIFAEFANTVIVYVKEGTGASATDASAELQPGGDHTPVINYTGAVTAYCASGTQYLKVTEF